jgi:LysM repeat protein
VRKWTKSACVVLALGILPLLAVVGFRGTSHPAQAKISIASNTQATSAGRPATLMTVTATLMAPVRSATWVVRPGDTLSAIATAFAVHGGWQALYAANRAAIGSNPDNIRTGTTLTLPATAGRVRYAVAPGDTLSSIAAALAVPGGWRALYTANRRVIGPDPDIIRPGTTLVTPNPAAARQAPAPAAAGPGSGQASPPPAAVHPSPIESPSPRQASGGSTASPSHRPAPGGGTAVAGAMPRWLQGTLLAAALLTAIAFIVELALVVRRRRKCADRAAPPRGAGAAGDLEEQAADQRAAERTARIVEANHERLIVTYSVSDDTVYLLTPPGEDPRAVLRAARLVLPEDNYQELAGHLGVAPGWRE